MTRNKPRKPARKPTLRVRAGLRAGPSCSMCGPMNLAPGAAGPTISLPSPVSYGPAGYAY